jgi:hypothetical protein
MMRIDISGMKKPVVALLFLVVGSSIFYAVGGIILAVVFFMLWIDKIIFGELKTPMHFGIELYSIPAVLVGIVYGPMTGFLFGFFIIPIIGGIFDILYPLLLGASLLDTGWEPFFPSPESFTSGVIGIVAGVYGPYMSLLSIGLMCMAIRFLLTLLRDKVFDMPTNIISYGINFALGVVIIVTFQDFLASLL